MTDKWKEICPWTMPDFLKHFTLHDSALDEMTLDGQGSSHIAIYFDVVWNKKVPQGHDYLELRFDLIYDVQWEYGVWRYNTIADAQSRVLKDDEKLKLMENAQYSIFKDTDVIHLAHPSLCPDLTLTTIEFMNNGTLKLIHQGSVRFRVADDAGEFCDVSTLVK